jgi:FkbM family methyltransferase
MMNILKNIFRLLGLEVTRRRDLRKTLYQSLDYHVNEKGINIDAFIDVGVADGTPAIYDLFPNLEGFLIDPIETEKTRSILKNRPNYKFIKGAAGNPNFEESMTFFKKENINGSSFYASQEEIASASKIKVEIISISEVIKTMSQKHLLLKLDVDGSELDIVRELDSAAAENITILVVEVNFKPKHKGVPDFSLLNQEILDKGFRLSDIIDIRYHRGDLFQADVVYLKGE